MITVPPANEEYNLGIINHPDYEKVSRQVKVVNIIGGCSLILPFLKLFLPEIESIPGVFPFLVACAVFVMPASIFVVGLSGGLAWYNIRTTVPNPSPIIGQFVSAIALVVTGVMYSFVAYSRILAIAGVIALVVWVSMLMTTKEFKAYTKLDIGNMFALLIVSFTFSFGAVTTTNCNFDGDDGQLFPTLVTEKEIDEDSDHDKSYFLHYQPVGSIDDDEIEVQSRFFDSVEVGDEINLRVRSGRWGIGWYYLEKRATDYTD